jgi:hypothetical protein
VHPYTVNEPNEMAALLAIGVDGMFTNFPDRLTLALQVKPPRRLTASAPSMPPCLAQPR